jgi:hypothetical protein
MSPSTLDPTKPIPATSNGAAVKDDTKLSLSDTNSKMTKPQLPTPHKHQIHVLIIGIFQSEGLQ